MRIEYGAEFKNPVHPYDVLVDDAKCLEFLGSNGLSQGKTASLVIEVSNNISTAYDGIYYPTNKIIINHFNAWCSAYERSQSLKGVNTNLSSALIHEMQHALDYDKLVHLTLLGVIGSYFGYTFNLLEVRARHAQLKYGTDPYWNSLVRLVPRDNLTV